MNTLQHGLGARALIIASLAVFVLAGCGTLKNQGSISSDQTPSATQPLQQSARESSLKPGPCAFTAEACDIKPSSAIQY
jgi:hypothetical protein